MYNRIPQEFKENEPFCLWRIEKDKKIPYQITGQRADSSNPATFATDTFRGGFEAMGKQKKQKATQTFHLAEICNTV